MPASVNTEITRGIARKHVLRKKKKNVFGAADVCGNAFRGNFLVSIAEIRNTQPENPGSENTTVKTYIGRNPPSMVDENQDYNTDSYIYNWRLHQLMGNILLIPGIGEKGGESTTGSSAGFHRHSTDAPTQIIACRETGFFGFR